MEKKNNKTSVTSRLKNSMKKDVKKPVVKTNEVKVVEKKTENITNMESSIKNSVEKEFSTIVVPGNEKKIITLPEEPKVDLLEKNNQERGLKWMEDQIDELNNQVEFLQAELNIEKENVQVLLEEINIHKNNKHTIDPELEENLYALYNELYSNYTGNNRQRMNFVDVKIEYILNKMGKLFPFLDKGGF